MVIKREIIGGLVIFDAETDFDVKKSPAPPKSAENHVKTEKNREIFFGKKIKFGLSVGPIFV